jgi:hypothetical protein
MAAWRGVSAEGIRRMKAKSISNGVAAAYENNRNGAMKMCISVMAQ